MNLPRAIRQLTVVLALTFAAAPSMAVDVTLLLGYQFNADFEVGFDASGGTQPLDSSGPGDDLELESGAVLGLAVDFPLQNPTQRIGFHLTHSQTELGSNAGLSNPDMDVTHLHFTAMNYYPDGKLEPFVLAGVGVAHFSPADGSLDSSTNFSAQIAAGANYQLSENLLLRMEARWLPTFFNGSSGGFCSGGCTVVLKSDIYNQFQANVGLQFRF